MTEDNITIITQSTEERNKEFQLKYQEYYYLFYNTNLPQKEILKKIDLQPQSYIWKSIKKKWRNDNEFDAIRRGMLINYNNWLRRDEEL